MSLGSASNFFLGAASATGAGGFELLKSVRFNSDDSAHLSRTPSSEGNLKKWTWAGWVKRSGTAGQQLFSAGTGTEERAFIRFLGGSDTLCFEQKQSSTWNTILRSSAVFRDISAWYHIVVAYDSAQSTAANRVNMYVNGAEITEFGSTTYPPQDQDGKINTTTIHAVGTTSYSTSTTPFSGYMADVYFIDGQALDPTSFGEFNDSGVWQAKDASGLTFGTNGFHLLDFANESVIGNDSSGNDNDWTANNFENVTSNNTNKVDNVSNITQLQNNGSNQTINLANLRTMMNSSDFQDADTDNSTWGVRVGGAIKKFGVKWSNLTGLTGVSVRWQRASTYDADVKTTGTGITESTNTVTSTRSQVTFSTTETSGEVLFEDVTSGSTNGFYIRALEFKGYGSVTYPTNAENFVAPGPGQDVLFDVPTNGTQSDTGAGGELSSNYCTWNPLAIKNGGATAVQCVDGNLNFGDQGNASSYGSCVGTIGVTSGKWYFEVTLASGSGVDTNVYVGILPIEEYQTNSSANAFNANNSALSIRGNGAAYRGDDSSTAGYATGVEIGDTLGFAFDVDAGTMTCFLNTTSLGTFPYSLAAGKTWVPFATDWSNAQPVSEHVINCGQRPWVATPPTDYKAICTANLPEATIPDGSDNFEAKTFTGTGAEQVVTGLEFQPDLTLFAIRDNARERFLFDSHRGATFYLQTSVTSGNPGQTEDSTTLTSFNSDGFTVGSSADVNRSTSPIIAWNWKAGSSSSNTDGTISSTVRANPSAGFSIVSWTGTGSAGTVGHGLGATPEFIIAKVYDTGYADNWPVYHSAFGATKYMYFNRDIAATTFQHFWNDTEPTSSVFTVGTYNSDNTKNLIAYCFAPVAGYSSFGTFYSNANADNQFVFTGFKPRFVLWKAYAGTLSTGDWAIYDSARQTYNPQGPYIIPNDNSIEGSTTAMDFCSNGFKVRNGLGGNRDMLYAAFAENPFSGNGGIAG